MGHTILDRSRSHLRCSDQASSFIKEMTLRAYGLAIQQSQKLMSESGRDEILDKAYLPVMKVRSFPVWVISGIKCSAVNVEFITENLSRYQFIDRL